jgi:hypothetical protein
MSHTRIAFLLAAPGLLLVAGCAQTGPIGTHRTTLGSLKAGVSHLEFENEQLRRKVAQLESDNREVENRLTQEETTNGDLSARLDDARNLLKRKGYDVADEGRSGARPRDDEPAEPATTLPAGRSNKKPRKAPFARIPGRIDTVPADDSPDPILPEALDPPSARPHDDLGPQSRLDDTDRWLPVARDSSAPSSRVR